MENENAPTLTALVETFAEHVCRRARFVPMRLLFLSFKIAAPLGRRNVRRVCANYTLGYCTLLVSVKCKSLGYCAWDPWYMLYLLYASIKTINKL